MVAKSGSDSGVGAETGALSTTVSGADTGTGSESGYVRLTQSGGDTGTGSESGYIGQNSLDSGSGTETGSVGATVTTGDTAAGTETSNVAAATTGSDSGSGAETGTIRLPGSDTGAGTETLTSLQATVAAGDTGVGADGGYVDALFGDLVIAVYVVNPTDGTLLALPDYTSLTVTRRRDNPGSITLTYPVTGLNFAQLRAWTIDGDRDVEIEVWSRGSLTGGLRWLLQEASGDDVKEDGIWTFAGGGLEIRMSEAAVFPQPIGGANANPNGEIVFAAATPGGIIATLLAQAQARGALTDVTTDFTALVDSSSVAWPNVLTAHWPPSTGYDAILARLVSLGLIEWSLEWNTTARILRAWIPGNRGDDRTIGARPVVLRRGRNLTEAPRKWSVRTAGTAVLAAGSQGVYQNASDASALARRGRRIERSTSSTYLSDSGAVQALAQTELAAITPGTLEVTHGLGFLPGEPRPVVAFDIGDHVYSQTGLPLDRLRVVEWTLKVDAKQNPSGTVTLNDSQTEALLRLQDAIARVSSGDAVVGTSTSSTDTGVPNPPTSLTASSVAYLVGGRPQASVTVGWTAPVQNVDGSTITDLAGYTVQFSIGIGSTNWQYGANVTSGAAVSGQFSTSAGVTINIRVAAYDQSANTSAWSAMISHTTARDVTAPPVTSTPAVSNYLGVLKIGWDGQTSTGADMFAAAPDFDHVDVHLSTSSGFTPSTATYFDRLFAGGTVVYTDGAYGVTYYAKLVALDTSGNASLGSAQGSDTLAQVVSADVFDGAVGTAKLADAAITTAKINDLAVNNAKIGDLSVGKLTAGTLSVAVTLSGIIRTSISGLRTEIDAAGIRLYDSTNALTFNASTTFGTVSLVGSIQTGVTGRRIQIVPGQNSIQFFPTADETRSALLSSFIPTNFPNDIVLQMESIHSGATTVFSRVTTFPDRAYMQVSPQSDSTKTITEWQVDSGAYFGSIRASNNVEQTLIRGDAYSIQGTVQGLGGTTTQDGGYFYLGRNGYSGTAFGNQVGGAGGSDRLSFSGSTVYLVRQNVNQIVIDGNGPSLKRAGGLGTTNGRLPIAVDGGGDVAMAYGPSGFSFITHSSGAFIKTFVIDHPLDKGLADDDPARRHLVHGVTESPHAGVEYWGVVTVEDGQAVVELPGYFEALTRVEGRAVLLTVLAEDDPAERLTLPRRTPHPDRTVPVSLQHGPAAQNPPPGLPSHVQASYPRDGRFTVWTSGPVDTFRVMWLVKAIRADVDALDVEPLKTSGRVAGTGPYTYLVPQGAHRA